MRSLNGWPPALSAWLVISDERTACPRRALARIGGAALQTSWVELGTGPSGLSGMNPHLIHAFAGDESALKGGS